MHSTSARAETISVEPVFAAVAPGGTIGGMVQVTSLISYPIKACQGVAVESSRVEKMGLEDDRRMMVVTEAGAFLTQRECPRLAWVEPKLEDGMLTLSARGFDSIRLPTTSTGIPWPVNIWKSAGVQAIDQGEDAAEWFSDWLGRSVRLVHLAQGFIRRINEEYALSADDHTGFADGYPILLTSEESLTDLNARLEEPVPMNRFRPNLVVGGAGPFAEDAWRRIRIGDVDLAVVKPCARCVVTTIDKETLEQGKEPLRTLASYRRQDLGAIFGQNVIPLHEGRLEVGMSVTILS